MMKPLDLFPFEAPADSGLPIQGRILLRRSQYRLSVEDVRDFIANGSVKPHDDPDQAQAYGAQGF